MAVKFTKPEFDIREQIQAIPPIGEASASLLQVETRRDQHNLLGISGRRNLIINGNFEVWQRGTTGSVVAGPGYVSADRWKIYVNTSTTITLSREDFSPGQIEVEGNPRHFGRFNWLGTGSTQFFGIEQLVEGCHWGSGEYITVSFYARTQTGESITLGVNQKFGTSGSSDQACGNFDVETTEQWKKFEIQIPMPSIKGKTVNESDDSLSFTWYRNGQTDSYLDLAQVQVEVGKGATPFEHRSYGEELALCERFYQKSYDKDAYVTGSTSLSSAGAVDHYGTSDATNVLAQVYFRTQMRDAPAVTTYNPNEALSGSAYPGRAYLVSNSGTASYNTTTNNIASTGFRSYVPRNGGGWTAHRLIFQWQAVAEL